MSAHAVQNTGFTAQAAVKRTHALRTSSTYVTTLAPVVVLTKLATSAASPIHVSPSSGNAFEFFNLRDAADPGTLNRNKKSIPCRFLPATSLFRRGRANSRRSAYPGTIQLPSNRTLGRQKNLGGLLYARTFYNELSISENGVKCNRAASPQAAQEPRPFPLPEKRPPALPASHWPCVRPLRKTGRRMAPCRGHLVSPSTENRAPALTRPWYCKSCAKELTPRNSRR